MTYEESQLLYKDLCARVPYGVKYHWKGRTTEDELPHVLGEMNSWMIYYIHEGFVKPYLRSMSSLTPSELDEYSEIENAISDYDVDSATASGALTDWLNEHHIDYHGLIRKGLALEAPEGMYDKQ